MVGGAARTLFAFAVGWSLVAVLPGAVFRGFLSIAPELAEKTPRFPAEVAVGIGSFSPPPAPGPCCGLQRQRPPGAGERKGK